jgi:hypothetical protein
VKYGNDDIVILSFDWEDSVNQRKMHEGDVCAFKFEEREGYLVVKVHKIQVSENKFSYFF